ncbi:MAG: hypothetical protein M1825_002247 [Sarcosagium campestre]|nr:MAG: hypothetical protein M1825_002247 [Sarcosagium campestre]
MDLPSSSRDVPLVLPSTLKLEMTKGAEAKPSSNKTFHRTIDLQSHRKPVADKKPSVSYLHKGVPRHNHEDIQPTRTVVGKPLSHEVPLDLDPKVWRSKIEPQDLARLGHKVVDIIRVGGRPGSVDFISPPNTPSQITFLDDSESEMITSQPPLRAPRPIYGTDQNFTDGPAEEDSAVPPTLPAGRPLTASRLRRHNLLCSLKSLRSWWAMHFGPLETAKSVRSLMIAIALYPLEPIFALVGMGTGDRLRFSRRWSLMGRCVEGARERGLNDVIGRSRTELETKCYASM